MSARRQRQMCIRDRVAYNLVDKIRGHLQSIMTSGKLTQDELDQLNKRS